jgi:hypothetical protein
VRPLLATVLYLAGVFLGGALLAPGLYFLMQWLAGEIPALAETAAKPFHRYVNRSLLALALLGLWPYVRAFGLNSRGELGLGKSARGPRDFGVGFALGFASLAAVAAVALLCGGRLGNTSLPPEQWGSVIPKAALTAGVVAVIEETLFRGALFGVFRRSHSWVTAAAISSALYSLLHFFQRPESPAEVQWTSGLALLPRMMRGFTDVEALLPGFVNLFLIGMILAVAYQRSGYLYGSIGLHAAWILWQKTYGVATSPAEGAQAWLWGSGKLLDGWLALGVLGATLVWVARSRRLFTGRSSA